jgi:predicted amidohydrolase YtcJ
MSVTVYRTRRILTMDPARPVATHVAVRDGRILAVGSAESTAAWGAHRLDTTFADAVLMPGFVEAHCHVGEGGAWRSAYCGFHDRVDPDGRRWPGVTSIEAAIDRLAQWRDRHPDPSRPILGWGFDPIHFGRRRCTRADLDRLGADRPVILAHASGHILNANTAALARIGWLDAPPEHPGVPRAADGRPTGELLGPEVMTPLMLACGISRADLATDEDGLRAFGRACVRTGTTTATELGVPLPEAAIERMRAFTADERFPVRLVWAMHARGQSVARTVERALAQRAHSSDRLRMGCIKVHLDGSMQGFTARLKWPHYLGGEQGLWYVEPEHLLALYEAALAAGLQVHSHTNGDEATELAIDCIERALRRHPASDHRFTLQHCQMAGPAQLRRMAALGIGANFFANHAYFWGDVHREVTLGPDRAERLNPCRSAKAIGVPFAIHSDAPVTPLGPLFTAWCAVNRLTASGRVLGGHERLEVDDALRAITLGAAATLRLDGEIGSIETGKRADFAVLHDDPLDLPPDRLRDVRVRGTVQDGRWFEAPAAP